MKAKTKSDAPEASALRQEVKRLQRRIKELEKVNNELTERTLELFSLYELSASLGTGARFDRMHDGSMDIIGDLLGIDQFSLQLFDPVQKMLIIKASLGMPTEVREQCRITPPDGVSGYVFTTGEVLYVPDVTKEPRYLFYQGLNTQGGCLFSIPLLNDENKPFGVLNISKPKPNAFTEKDLTLYSAVALQITALIQNFSSYNRLQELSLTDELTGIGNRRAFFEALDREHERHRRNQQKYSLLLIDVDYFKRYNDRHGHLEGDLALQKLAQLLKSRLRKSDILTRYGGEEFAICAGETSKDEGLRLAEALRKVITETKFQLTTGDPASELSITVGIATYPDDGVTFIQVLDKADKALYYGKSSGRNTVSSIVPPEAVLTGHHGAKGGAVGRRGKGTPPAS